MQYVCARHDVWTWNAIVTYPSGKINPWPLLESNGNWVPDRRRKSGSSTSAGDGEPEMTMLGICPLFTDILPRRDSAWEQLCGGIILLEREVSIVKGINSIGDWAFVFQRNKLCSGEKLYKLIIKLGWGIQILAFWKSLLGKKFLLVDTEVEPWLSQLCREYRYHWLIHDSDFASHYLCPLYHDGRGNCRH